MTAATTQEYVIGVDLGGTNVVTGALRADGARTYGVRSAPTAVEAGAEGVVDRIVAQIEATMADAMAEAGVTRDAFRGVGIGAPGPLDRERGLVIVAPNLGWRDFPLRDRISDRVGLPASLDNDANCATVGEWWLGAARGARHVVGLTIGTGIGGGLIIDGRLFHGASDVAGEIGHTTIDVNGRHCKCGNYGCLEAYASGPAIATRAREVLMREGAELADAGDGERRPRPAHRADGVRRGQPGRPGGRRDRARHGAVPGRGRGQPAQHLQSRGRGGGRRRDAWRGIGCSRRWARRCAGAHSRPRWRRCGSWRGSCRGRRG